MITALRRLFGSTIGKAVALAFIILIGVLFALGDVTGNRSFGGVGGANVATVGRTDIGIGELRERVRQAYNQARQEQPGLTMPAFVAAGGLDQVLKQMVEGLAFEFELPLGAAGYVALFFAAIWMVLRRRNALAALQWHWSGSANQPAPGRTARWPCW